MKIKFKKLHPDAVVPKYAHDGDACVDLVAVSDFYADIDSNSGAYDTGLAIEIPKGYTGLIFPRSSICKKDIYLSNSVGVIDSGYTGEIKFKFKLCSEYIIDDIDQIIHHELVIPNLYKKGDKIGQLMIIPIPKLEFEEVEELSTTDRNTGGFGSSGN